MKINYISIYQVEHTKNDKGQIVPTKIIGKSCHPVTMFADAGNTDFYYEVHLPEILENAYKYASVSHPDLVFSRNENNTNFNAVVMPEERPFQYENCLNVKL